MTVSGTRSGGAVAGIGEILMDVFEDGTATLGGAPFNVTFHLHQLLQTFDLGEGIFLSATGEDHWGQAIRQGVADAGISTRYLALDREHPTGTAMVFHQEDEVVFNIGADVAWDYLDFTPELEQVARTARAVIFGSLAQRAPLARATIQRFVTQVNGPRLYDVNLRQNTGDRVRGYSPAIVRQSLALATIVKMNDAELHEISEMLGIARPTGEDDAHVWHWMDRLAAEFTLTAVAVTRGARGALLVAGDQHLRLPDSTLDPSLVHPVGAGDSFAAGLLFGFLSGWPAETSIQMANTLSSWVVQQVSATPAMPESIQAEIRRLASQASADADRLGGGQEATQT